MPKLASVVLALLLAPAAVAGPGEPILLRFKPSGGAPPIYQLKSNSTTRMQTTTGESTQRYGFSKEMRRTTTDAGGGELSVLIEDAGGTFEVNGTPAVEHQPEDASRAPMTITSTGQATGGLLAVRGQVGGIEFVLPEKAVQIGDTWQLTVPAREEFPVPIQVSFKLIELKEAKGRQFAIVQSWADVDQKVEDRPVAVTMQHRGRTAFDVAAGHISQASNSLKLKLRYLADNIANLKETETETNSQLKLVESKP